MTVSFTVYCMKRNSSSHSLLSIFPNSATSWSSFWYYLMPVIMAAAHSIIKFFRPYLWFRYVYMNYSIVSRGSLFSSHFWSNLVFYW